MAHQTEGQDMRKTVGLEFSGEGQFSLQGTWCPLVSQGLKIPFFKPRVLPLKKQSGVGIWLHFTSQQLPLDFH